jgi:hypothetical protein
MRSQYEVLSRQIGMARKSPIFADTLELGRSAETRAESAKHDGFRRNSRTASNARMLLLMNSICCIIIALAVYQSAVVCYAS